MTTITINQDLNWDKINFNSIEELKAYLMGILTESQDDLMDELDERIKYMNEHPEENVTVQEAIYYAKYGKDKI